MEMNWEQKALAIQSLVGWQNFSVKMCDLRNWYVEHKYLERKYLERKEGGFLSGGCQSEPTPEDAITVCWEWLTDENFYLVYRAACGDRRAVKWNGFMWEDVQEDK